MSKIATAVPSSPQRPELPPCVWTDEELEALADEADAEGGEPIDGETFLQEMLAQAQAQIRAAAAAR